MAGTKKIALPEAGKSTKKPAIKKMRQQKRAAPLTEENEEETLQDEDGCKEKAARSKVRFEKEIERQVLGNEGMASTQAQQLKGKGWKMCLYPRKRLHVQK